MVAAGAMKGEIVLRPWARLEGIAWSGAKPLSGRSVHLVRTDNATDQMRIIYEMTLKTDDQGRFVCDRIMPGEWAASAPSQTSRAVRTQRVKVSEAGTSTVVLGGSGLAVVGRIHGAPARAVTEGTLVERPMPTTRASGASSR